MDVLSFWLFVLCSALAVFVVLYYACKWSAEAVSWYATRPYRRQR